MSTIGADLIAWNGFSDHWIANADRIAEWTVGATDALLARLAPEPPQHLLDVASGVGDPALRLARMVAPGGHVTATDGVAPMSAALRRRAAERGLDNLTVLTVAAEAIDLPPGSFDGACCRFGAMFFPEPQSALGRMQRAVRRDGRLVLAVWGEKTANSYFTLAMDALDAVGAPSVPMLPGTRTVFHFAQPGELLGIARAAGWRALREDAVPFDMTLRDTSPDGLLDALASMSARVAERLALLPPTQHDAARAAVAQRAAPLARGPHIVFPALSLLISGRS